MDAQTLGVLAGVVLLTSALSATAGFGGGSVLLAVMLQFMPPGQAIPVHGLVQAAANLQRTWLYRKALYWALIWRFFLLLPLGIVLGRWMFIRLERPAVEVLIGLFLLGALGLRRLGALRRRELPLNAFLPLGLVLGVLNILVGVVAPLLSVLLMRRELSREGQVGSVAICSLWGHVAKVAAFAYGGFGFEDFLAPFFLLLPAVLLGGWLGTRILTRLSELWFRRLVLALVLVLGLKLVLWQEAWLRLLAAG